MKTVLWVLLFTTSIPFFRMQPLKAQWVQTNGITDLQIVCLAASDTNLFAGTNAGIYRSGSNGSTWTHVSTGLLDTYINSLLISGTHIFAATDGAGIFVSSNNGTSWNAANSGMTESYVYAFAVSGKNLLAGTKHGVFLSTNNGASWTVINSNFSVISFAVSGAIVFAGTDYGVYRSTDNGLTWFGVSNGISGAFVITLAVSDANIFAGTYQTGIFLSTNNGASWNPVNSGLLNNTIVSFAQYGKMLFAATFAGGVYLTTTNGASWTLVNDGLTNNDVWALAILGTELYTGTNGSGVWRRPLSEMITSVDRLSSDIPAYFSLSKNYPNPFNPSTTIEFSVPQTGFVSLKIFNALGKVVSTLVDEELQPGSYWTKWDASGLAGGVYFYRLEAGVFSEMKKLIVMR
jgi:hypothetical protein